MTEPENALAHVEATQDMVVVLDALSRVADATSTAGVESVFLQGSPGERKAKLVERLYQDMEAHRGAHVVRLKVSRCPCSKPFSLVADCFIQLFDLATQSPHKDGIVTKLQEGLTKSDRTLLGMLAPNLYDLIENDKSATEHSHLELARCKVCNLQDRQVQSVCVTVLQILTTEFQRPVVLLWEDLHWASAALLDFIKHILVADVTYLALFTYVTSKNSSNHGLPDFLHSLDETSVRTNYLEIDDGPVSSTNYVRFIAKTVEFLSVDSKTILKIAALLGSQFSKQLLGDIFSNMSIDVNVDLTSPMDFTNTKDESDVVDAALSECVSKGLMVTVMNRYQFVDDSVHDTVLRTLHEDPQRLPIILMVGRILHHLSSQNADLLLPAVRQMNTASDIVPHTSVSTLARLNLDAAQQASHMSAFGLAVEYSQKGLVLLGDSKWQTEYPLSLALATSLAEMSLADHNYIGCKIAIDEVVLNAESIDDKQPVYYILIESLCDQGRADECIELGLQLLQTMGEKVRNNGFRLGVTPSNVRTQFNKNSNDFCDRPPMKNPAKLEVCKLLYRLGEIAWNHDNFQLATQLLCRIAQISLKHGPNKYSALGFAALGLGLRQDDHMDESIRAGHIALTLSARRLSTLSDAMAESMVYYFIDHWSTPYSTCRAALEDSYRRIQGTGDVSHSVFCGHILISLGRLSGEPLSQLNVMCHELVDEVKRHNAEHLILRVLPGYQFQLNMMGEARDTLVLSGDAMTEETFVAKCAELHVVCPVIVFHVQKMKLAYYFCKYDKANESKKEVYKYLDVKQCGPQAMLPTAIWFGGLIAVEMYNLTSHKKHLQDAKKELLKLQKWKKAGCQNAIHMAFLLEAEIAAASQLPTARELFRHAIQAADAINYAQDRALANERAAVHCLAVSDTASACEYMVEATRMYNRWEAKEKVLQIKGKYPYLFYDQNSAVSSLKSHLQKAKEHALPPMHSAAHCTSVSRGLGYDGGHGTTNGNPRLFKRRHNSTELSKSNRIGW